MVAVALAELSFEFPHLWPMGVLVAALAVWVCLRVYAVPLEGGRRLGFLPGLRCAALLLVAVSVIGPVWRRPATDAERGEIVVLVDTSRSMGVVDVQRTPAERLRVAMALGAYRDEGETGEGRRREATEEIASAVDALAGARASVDFVELTRADPRDARGRLADAREQLSRLAVASAPLLPGPANDAVQRILALPDAGSAGWRVQAGEHLRRAAAALDADLLSRLTRTVGDNAEASKSAAAIAVMSRLRLATEILGDGVGLFPAGVPLRVAAGGREVGKSELASLRAEGLTEPSASMFGRIAASEVERRVRAVVLLSDGRGMSTADLAELPPGIKVHTVALAPESQPPGVRVARFDVPDSMITGQSARVRVALRSIAAAGPAEVRLILPGQTQLRTVTLSNDTDAVAEFDLVADRAGDLPLELLVTPRADDAPGTAVRLRRVVRVSAERARVLMVTGFPSWDAQQLRNTLNRLPWVRLTHVAATGDLAALIARADGVVFADLAPGRLSPESRRELRDLVERRVGGVLLLPGPRRVPFGWAMDPELQRYLPGSDARWVASPGAEGSFIAESARGSQSGGLEFSWNERGPFWRVLRFESTSPASTPLLVDVATGWPILSETRVGLGRSVFVHTDQAWRFSRGVPDAPSPWAAVVGRVVETPYPTESAGLALDATVRLAQSGRGEVAVRVRSLAADASPSSAQPPRIVLRESGRTVVGTAPTPTAPGRFSALLTDIPPGEYTLQFEAAEEPRLLVRVGDGGEGELAQPAGDRAALAWLSVATGGVAATAENLAPLAEALATTRDGSAVTLRTIRLWNSPALMILILSLLSAEWALRKHWGLA